MFAHVTTGTVDSVGNPPQLVFSGGRWYDLRDRDAATLATVGWYPVQEVAKPADTALTTWTPVFTPNGAVVVQSWIEVAKTPEQLAGETAAANESTIRAETEANLAKLDAEIINLTNAVLFTQSATGNALKLLARTLRLVIRLLIRRFDGTT